MTGGDSLLLPLKVNHPRVHHQVVAAAAVMAAAAAAAAAVPEKLQMPLKQPHWRNDMLKK
jgi:ribosomal protein S12 methylthiotransferase accessory factor YcaO